MFCFKYHYFDWNNYNRNANWTKIVYKITFVKYKLKHFSSFPYSELLELQFKTLYSTTIRSGFLGLLWFVFVDMSFIYPSDCTMDLNIDSYRWVRAYVCVNQHCSQVHIHINVYVRDILCLWTLWTFLKLANLKFSLKKDFLFFHKWKR